VRLDAAVQAGMLEILTAMPEAAGVEQHLLRMLQRIERFEPRHVVVDAISAFRRMGSEHAAFDLSVRLLNVARQHGITCLYTNQATEAEDVMQITGLGISSLVDTLIAMPYCDDGQGLTRRLLVVKSRGGPHSMRYHDFAITSDGIAFARGPDAGGSRPKGGVR